jgi:hypothetical protein
MAIPNSESTHNQASRLQFAKALGDESESGVKPSHSIRLYASAGNSGLLE